MRADVSTHAGNVKHDSFLPETAEGEVENLVVKQAKRTFCCREHEGWDCRGTAVWEFCYMAIALRDRFYNNEARDVTLI